jgi:thiosulfate/3-mercaptopyruvate sulfurtransferase
VFASERRRGAGAQDTRGRGRIFSGHTPRMPSAITSPIVSPEELFQRLSDPSLRVADVRWYLGKPGRGRTLYEEGHLPGAIFVDLDEVLAAHDGPGRHPLPDPAEFARSLAALGIGDEHEVVVYDDVGGSVAARLWWMLDNLGHRAVRLLDGGIPAWVAAGLPVETAVATYPPAPLDLASTWRRMIDRDALRDQLGSVTLLDARAGERYRGEVEPVDPVPGHIPTAVSAPALGNVGPDGRLLAPAALLERYRALGVDDRPAITSCGSGVTACLNALAMRVAGLPDPILYAGSYSDWSSAGEAIATGNEPGMPPGIRKDSPAPGRLPVSGAARTRVPRSRAPRRRRS